MSLVKDAIAAMREVITLTEKVDQVGKIMDAIAIDQKDHEKRIVRLETLFEIAKMQPLASKTDD